MKITYTMTDGYRHSGEIQSLEDVFKWADQCKAAKVEVDGKTYIEKDGQWKEQ